MADDLEAFLRQAAQRRSDRKKPARSQPATPEPRKPAPRQPVGQKTTRRPTPAAVEVAEVVEPEVLSDTSTRLETHLDTSDFQRRAGHLGEEVGLADEHVEAHLHETFNHRLGALDDGSGESSSRNLPQRDLPSTVDEIVQLLAHPDSLRNAIVLSEVLSPPSHRW